MTGGDKMSIGIYKIENLVNGKIYIGQSIHVEKRWKEHCQPSANSLIGMAIQKYGKTNFSFQLLEEIPPDQLNKREAYYIRYYNSLSPNGYNLVIEDEQKKEQFNNYSPQTLDAIIFDITDNVLSFKEIAAKYNLDLSMIYYLNRGDYHAQPNKSYPLRPVRDMSKQKHFCIDCGQLLKTNSATRCPKCAALAQRRTERPSREQLKSLIRKTSFLEIGRMYGVTDNTIRKWCKGYSLPFKKTIIKEYNDFDWEKI